MSASIDYPVISGDSHFVEPPTMWVERIDARFRDRAPRSAPGKDGGHYFVCEDIPPEYVWVTSWFAAGKKSEELPDHFKKGWEAAAGLDPLFVAVVKGDPGKTAEWTKVFGPDRRARLALTAARFRA